MKTTTINLLGGKLFEYIPHCLGLYDSGITTFDIVAYGGNTHQALVLSQILKEINSKEKSTKNLGASIFEATTRYSSVNALSAQIQLNPSPEYIETQTSATSNSLLQNGFVEFPVYHLLLTNLLHTQKVLKISVNQKEGRNRETVDLLEIRLNDNDPGQLTIKKIFPNHLSTQENSTARRSRAPEEINRTNELTKANNRINSNLVAALYRSGYLLPNNWEKIGYQLANYDDVVIGLDTNLFLDAFVSNNLLPILSVIEKNKYIQTPNWILMVIPQMVAYELEISSNKKDDNGKFVYAGRKGFRALQEIMELRNNFDHKGISIINTGHSDALLDINSFLKSMNDNLYSLVTQKKIYGMKSPKSASGDMLIRSQFKNFVDELNFEKGAYFLTSDKVNAAMNTAQGNESIYVSKPHMIHDSIIQAPELLNGIQRTIPLGKLIYELLVDFGDLYLHLNDGSVIKLACDDLGQSLESWIRKVIKIPKSDFDKLIQLYKGKFNLEKVQAFYCEVSSQLEKSELTMDQAIKTVD
jgi:hypothetical protein